VTDAEHDQPLPLIAHLTELRDRLLRAILAVLVVFIVLFPFANDIYAFVSEPLRALLPDGASMIATEVASPFLTPFKLTLFTAIFVAMPYVLYQAWAFVAPGMYQREKRFALPVLPPRASAVLSRRRLRLLRGLSPDLRLLHQRRAQDMRS
jgi:sec-independent protein translocase protein TatC